MDSGDLDFGDCVAKVGGADAENLMTAVNERTGGLYRALWGWER